VESSGTLSTPGGTVQVLGDFVTMADSATVDVSSATGGGTVLIGGDYQGRETIPTAQQTVVAAGVQINASALESGDGGTVVVWSDEVTDFAGTITAQGGIAGGDGGLIETSSRGELDIGATAQVDARAWQGEPGTWLLDPTNLTVVQTGGTETTVADANNKIGDSKINAETVVAALNGTNVTLLADKTITVDAAINAIGNGAGGNLVLQAPTANLNQRITLVPGSVLDGTATLVNVGPAGSVQNGVDVAAVGGTVNLAEGTYIEGQTIAINQDVNIVGTKASSTVVSGNGAYGVFQVNGGTVTLSDLTITEGVAQGGNGKFGGGGGLGAGGGIFINNGSVTIDRVVLTGNQAIGGSSPDSPLTGTNPGRGGDGGGGGVGTDPNGDDGNAGGSGGNGVLDTSGNNGSAGDKGGTAGNVVDDLTGGVLSTGGTGGVSGGGGSGFGSGGGGGGGGGGGAVFADAATGGAAGGAGGNGGFGAGGGGGGGGGGGSAGLITVNDSTSGGTGGSGGSGGTFGGAGQNGTKGDPGIDGFGFANPGVGSTGGQGGGGAGLGGAIFVRSGTLTLRDSTLINNSTKAGTGFKDGSTAGGAIFVNTGAKADITNTTFSGNQAIAGGALYNFQGTTTLGNNTIVSNTASAAEFGGIFNKEGNLTLRNSIVAQNVGGNVGGLLTAANNNIIDVNVLGTVIAPTLAVNGGATPTYALLPGSTLAIDQAGFGATNTGQRGAIAAGNRDIGAYEARWVLTAASGDNQTIDVEQVFATPLVVTVQDEISGAPVNTTLTFQAPPQTGPSALLSGNTALAGVGITATANGILGSYQVTADTPGSVNAVAFNLTNALANNFVLTVDTLLDVDDNNIGFGQFSLREAMRLVAPGGIIQFSMDLGGETVDVQSPLPIIDADLLLSGLPEAPIISTSNTNPLFTIGGNATTVTFRDLIINGNVAWNAGGQNINLIGLNTQFETLSLTGGDVTLEANAPLDLAASSISNTLTVTATGPITDSGNLTVLGTGIFNAGGNNITLDSAGNQFGTLQLTGNNVVIQENAATDLGPSTIGNTLQVTSAGPITDSGTLTVAGTTTLNAGNNNIVLDSPNNQFGTLQLTGNTVSIQENAATDLGPATINGDLTVQAAGAITDSGIVTVAGTTTFNAGNDDITLDSAGNQFGTLQLTGNTVSIQENDATDLGASTISGDFTVTTTGAISNSGDLTVAGSSTFNAAGNAIALDSPNNRFGPLQFTADSVTLQEQEATELAPSVVNGPLTIKAAGPITASGALTIAGLTTLDAGGSDITLDSADNQFGPLQLTGNTAILQEKDATDLGVTTLTGDLTVTTAGPVTDSGNLKVGGTATFNAGGNNITLDSADNQFGSLQLIGNAIQLAGQQAIADDFMLMAQGTAIQSGGSLDVGGDTWLRTTRANAGDVVLSTTGNLILANIQVGGDFALQAADVIRVGPVQVAGETSVNNAIADLATTVDVVNGNYFVVGVGTIDLSRLPDLPREITGNLAVNAAPDAGAFATDFSGTPAISLAQPENRLAGEVTALTPLPPTTGAPPSITQSAPLSVTGSVTLNAETTGGITLTNPNNRFGNLLLTGNTVVIRENDLAVLDRTTVTGDLTVTARDLEILPNLSVGGNLTLEPFDSRQALQIGGGNIPGLFSLTSAEVERINTATPQTVILGSANGSGTLTWLIDGTDPFNRPVILRSPQGNATLTAPAGLTLSDVTVKAGDIDLTTFGDITLENTQLLGTLPASGTISLDTGLSQFQVRTLTLTGANLIQAPLGFVDIFADTLDAVAAINSDIIAGLVTITSTFSQTLNNIVVQSEPTPGNDIISTGFEQDPSGFDPSQGTVQLPAALEDASDRIQTGCGLGNTGDQGEFVVTGRGGLPPSAGDAIAAEGVSVPWVSGDGSAPVATVSPVPVPVPLVEAQSIALDADGNAYLVGQTPPAVTTVGLRASGDCTAL
jgi:hypothetical protein